MCTVPALESLIWARHDGSQINRVYAFEETTVLFTEWGRVLHLPISEPRIQLASTRVP